MDSFSVNGSSTDSDDEDSTSECDSVATIQEDDQSTPDYNDEEKCFSFENVPSVENAMTSTNDAQIDGFFKATPDETENISTNDDEVENDDWVYDDESGYWIAKDKSGVHSFRIVIHQ